MPLTVEDIGRHLSDALPAADAGALSELAAALHAAWSEPHRAYHSLQHLQECLTAFEPIKATARQPAAVALALLFHDAVYQPQRHDNEALSAEWAVKALGELGAAPQLIDAVAALIMATQSHRVDGTAADAKDIALLLDIDLAILGSDAARFAEYEAKIRREYAFVPEAQYEVARHKVMQGFAHRDPLFLTERFRQRLGALARRNLAVFA